MTTKAPPFGAVSIRAPQLSQLQLGDLDAPSRSVKLYLSFDPQLSTPLFAGVVPAQDIGLPSACTQARYALWTSTGTLPTGEFTFDVDQPASPGDVWLVYLVYGQPPDFGNKNLEQFSHDRTFNQLEFAAALFRRQEGSYANSQDAIDDVVRAVRAAEREALVGPNHVKLKLPPLRGLPNEPTEVSEAIDVSRRPIDNGRETPPLRIAAKVSSQDDQPTRFFLTSCLYPGGMLDRTPLLDGATSPSDLTLSLIAQAHTSDASRPDLVLMLGDQVYVDATAGLFDPQLADGRYTDPYAQWQSSACLRRVAREARIESMVDDHELADNWAPIAQDATSLLDDGRPGRAWDYLNDIKREGLNAYRAYRANRSSKNGTDKLHGPIGPDHQRKLVFMANTRTEREVRHSLNIDQARIMSAPQWADLTNWLQAAPKDAWRYLASPSMVLPRRTDACGATPASALRSDAWDGYPASLHDLLATICELRLNKLVLLSGDEHLASISRIALRRAATAQAPEIETVVHSVHAPAMYAPYPFANAKPDDFSQRPFSFSTQPSEADSPASPSAMNYTCEVETWFPEMGDGFIVIDNPAGTAEDQQLKLRLVCNDPEKVTTQMPSWLNASACLRVQIDKATAPAKIA